MRFADVVDTSAVVAATRSRAAKVEALAALVARLEPGEREAAVAFLCGEPRQGRIGVGWATLARVPGAPAAEASLTVADVDAALTEVASRRGAGSGRAREERLARLLAAATAAEGDFLRRVLIGEVRQGALEGVMVEGVARAAGVPATAVRRALMLGGDLPAIAGVAMSGGPAGLAAVRLQVGRAVRPMLAAGASSVPDALEGLELASVEWKLDGIRVQIHRAGDDVRIFTRNLNDITAGLPAIAAAVADLPAQRLVLDGEAIAFDETGRPWAFPDTAGEVGRDAPATSVQPFVFDVLHVDGDDLLDVPLAERIGLLDELAPALRMPGRLTTDPAEAQRVLDDALAAGHEGIVVKDAASAYAAGRRGRSWRKVKPVHTLDLVVLAAEWGHGRRRGWLSNLHLGARGPDGFVMVGKTFKGLTDALLAWQTTALLGLEQAREGHVVHVRPELVVEVAVDGVQTSRRYPGGVALRFARVRRYRPEKAAAEADELATVQALRR